MKTVTQGGSLRKIQAQLSIDFLQIIHQYQTRNLLFSIAINPDHIFLIEFDSGEFRIYQSWIGSFDLEYWTGTEKPICEKDADVLEQIAQARGEHGKLHSLSFMQMNRFMTALSSVLGVSHIDGKVSVPPEVATISRYLGKDVLDYDEIQKKEGNSVSIFVCYIVGPEVSPPRQRVRLSSSPRSRSSSSSGSPIITLPRSGMAGPSAGGGSPIINLPVPAPGSSSSPLEDRLRALVLDQTRESLSQNTSPRGIKPSSAGSGSSIINIPVPAPASSSSPLADRTRALILDQTMENLSQSTSPRGRKLPEKADSPEEK